MYSSCLRMPSRALQESTRGRQERAASAAQSSQQASHLPRHRAASSRAVAPACNASDAGRHSSGAPRPPAHCPASHLSLQSATTMIALLAA